MIHITIPRSYSIVKHLKHGTPIKKDCLPVENKMNQVTATYSAAELEEQAKEMFKIAFNRVQKGDATVDSIMNIAVLARKIAEKLEKYPEVEGIASSRFNAHQWADRIEGLTGK